jgi:hypothetical protein
VLLQFDACCAVLFAHLMAPRQLSKKNGSNVAAKTAEGEARCGALRWNW